MHTTLLLTARSLDALLRSALAAHAEGLVMMRDRDGLRHGIWVHSGYVVGAHVAGRFDPLLELLVRSGALDRSAHRRCVSALAERRERAGDVARSLAGVPASLVYDTLKLQIAERFIALREIASTSGYDARFEAGPVPLGESSVRLPLGSLLRRVARLMEAGLPSTPTAPHTPVSPDASAKEEARRTLRALAKSLHPDLHADLDEESRQRLTLELSRATALYHGFG